MAYKLIFFSSQHNSTTSLQKVVGSESKDNSREDISQKFHWSILEHLSLSKITGVEHIRLKYPF